MKISAIKRARQVIRNGASKFFLILIVYLAMSIILEIHNERINRGRLILSIVSAGLREMKLLIGE